MNDRDREIDQLIDRAVTAETKLAIIANILEQEDSDLRKEIGIVLSVGKKS